MEVNHFLEANTMKRKLLIPALSAIFILVAASGAMAGAINVGDYVKITAYNGINGGGIITLAVSPDKINLEPSYDTFCGEMTIHISPNVWYKVLGYQPLTGVDSYKAAYLFDKFLAGGFPGIDPAQQVELQEAIWMFLGEPIVAANQYVDDANLNAQNVNYHVVMLDLGRVQKMLYQSVPEPSILLLLGLGVSAIGLISRKK